MKNFNSDPVKPNDSYNITGGTISGTVIDTKTRIVTAAGDITVLSTDGLIVVNKTSGAATIVNLEAGTLGRTLTIKDGKGDTATNNITITPAAGTIDGSATFVMSVNYGSVTLIYNGTEWGIV